MEVLYCRIGIGDVSEFMVCEAFENVTYIGFICVECHWNMYTKV